MIILGLDPGIARTGFGVIDTSQSEPYVACGCLTTPQKVARSDRLHMLGQDLNTLITQYQPEHAVVESVFFGRNTSTAISTAEVRGVLIYLLRNYGVAVHNLTPLQIKSRLTGYGVATKQQVQAVVTRHLNLSAVPQPDDAADALAAALCLVQEPMSVSFT